MRKPHLNAFERKLLKIYREDNKHHGMLFIDIYEAYKAMSKLKKEFKRKLRKIINVFNK